MRVLFAARHSLPHLYTMAAAARACAAAGHEVRVAAPSRLAAVPYDGLTAPPPEPDWHPHLVVRAEHGDGPGPWPAGREVRFSPLDRRDPCGVDHGGGLCIDPCPPELRIRAEAGALSVRHEEAPPVRMPRWLERPPGRLRVCLRPGPDQHGRVWSVGRVHRVAHAVLGLDAELVAIVPPALRHVYREALDRQVRFAGPELLGPVLATCAGAVHEGGADVTLTAAAHGVPQLVLAGTRPPGDRLHRIGAGARLVAADARDARDLADALRLRRRLAELLFGGRALADAERLRARIAALPPPDALVRPLERYAAGVHRGDRHRDQQRDRERDLQQEGERGA